MKPSKNYIIPALIVMSLSGCKTLETIDQALKNSQQNGTLTTGTQEQAVISEPLSGICAQAERNAVRSNDLYVNKAISINGEVRSVKESYQPRYRVYMKSGTVSVHAGTDVNNISHLNVGQKTTVTGVIKSINHDFNGCSIALKDAKF